MIALNSPGCSATSWALPGRMQATENDLMGFSYLACCSKVEVSRLHSTTSKIGALFPSMHGSSLSMQLGKTPKPICAVPRRFLAPFAYTHCFDRIRPSCNQITNAVFPANRREREDNSHRHFGSGKLRKRSTADNIHRRWRQQLK